jgi:hypothetical protein
MLDADALVEIASRLCGSPSWNEIINFEESSLPTFGSQYNYFAISDIPEKNGRWYTCWWIPNEGSTWSLFGAWGGGWSAKTLSEEAGMEKEGSTCIASLGVPGNISTGAC